MREWTSGVERTRENQYAEENLKFDERKVNMYRMAFDILDAEGSNQLDISAVRKVFVLLRRSISSDNLRELFAKIDLDGSGTINFFEFLHLVHELDVGEWGIDHQEAEDAKEQRYEWPEPSQHLDLHRMHTQPGLGAEVHLSRGDLLREFTSPDSLERLNTEQVFADRCDD